MVVITELTDDPHVKVINGSWGIGPDGSWIFISAVHNPVRKLKIRDGEKYEKVVKTVREAFCLEYLGCPLHLTFQWPDCMDMEDIFGGKTKPVPIRSDETMSIFLAMHRELENINLYVSINSFDGISHFDCTSATTSKAVPDKGKAPMQCDVPPVRNDELTQLERLMEEDAVLRWMNTTNSSFGEPSGYSTLREIGHNIRTEDANLETTNVNEVPNLNFVEVDLLATLGHTPTSAAEDQTESESESDGCTFYDGDGNPREDSIRECSFFGPTANYMSAPLGVGRDLRIPLQEAVEDMCLNFAAFNRDAAPTLDEQGEEGITFFDGFRQ